MTVYCCRRTFTYAYGIMPTICLWMFTCTLAAVTGPQGRVRKSQVALQELPNPGHRHFAAVSQLAQSFHYSCIPMPKVGCCASCAGPFAARPLWFNVMGLVLGHSGQCCRRRALQHLGVPGLEDSLQVSCTAISKYVTHRMCSENC